MRARAPLQSQRLSAQKALRSQAGAPIVASRYTYDFGDGWEHAIVIEGKQPPAGGRSYPACIAGKRNCPPEDCGGCWGYQKFLAILADPAHPRRQEWVEMIGGDFDPEAFSVEAADARVAAWFGRRWEAASTSRTP